MKIIAVGAFLAMLGITILPDSSQAMPAAPGVTAGDAQFQHADAGCARGYYRSYGRCIPYSRGYRAPRYYAPRYYVAPPAYYYRPYRYDRPRYRYYRPYY